MRGAAVGIAALLAVRVASADPTKAECVRANADAQPLQGDGKYAAARELLQKCAVPACPALVRNDCAQRLSHLEEAQPTLVFDVVDGAGADVGGVTVAMDGRVLVERLAGIALRVDPGEHEFTFTAAGKPAVSRKLVVKEGEKDRRERVVLGAPPPAPAAPDEAPHGLGTRRIAGIALAGAGVAAVAVGSVFGALTFGAVSDQSSDCAGAGSFCAHRAQALSDHGDATTDAAVSTVAFIAGGVFLAGGAYLFFTAPKEAGKRPVSFVPEWTAHGASMLLSGEF